MLEVFEVFVYRWKVVGFLEVAVCPWELEFGNQELLMSECVVVAVASTVVAEDAVDWGIVAAAVVVGTY